MNHKFTNNKCEYCNMPHHKLCSYFNEYNFLKTKMYYDSYSEFKKEVQKLIEASKCLSDEEFMIKNIIE